MPSARLGDLHRAHQIVDQLVDRAGADRAEMPDASLTAARDKAARVRDRPASAPTSKRQLSGSRRVRQAGDRAIDIDEAAAAQLARHIERVLVRHGGAFDRQRAGLHCRGGAVRWPSHTARDASSSATMVTTASASIGGILPARVAHRAPRAIRSSAFALLRFHTATVKPGVEIAAGHAMAHAAQTDEGDFCHGLVHILDWRRARCRTRAAPASPP